MPASSQLSLIWSLIFYADSKTHKAEKIPGPVSFIRGALKIIKGAILPGELTQ